MLHKQKQPLGFMMQRWVLIILVLLILEGASAFAWVPDRRQDQFSTQSGYLVVPAPYEYPGVGSGMMLIGNFANVISSQADVTAIGFNGDAEGYVGQVGELFLLPETLFVRVFAMEINKLGSNIYSSRGMSSAKDDYNVFVSDQFYIRNQTATLTFWDRRIEFASSRNQMGGSTYEIRNPEGGLVATLDNRLLLDEQSKSNRIRLNLTDDLKDPRTGLDVWASRTQFHAPDLNSSEFAVTQMSLTGYIPLMQASTWVFNAMRADAHVSREGETNLEQLKQKNGYYFCELTSDPTACEKAKLAEATNSQKANKYGSSGALGGTAWLRAYPDLRFEAAHSAMIGTELRFNHEMKGQYQSFIFNDVINSLQLALFAEVGSVSELEQDLGNETRSGVGAGLRLITQSGSIYRFDVATGDEGSQLIVFFNYPWENAF